MSEAWIADASPIITLAKAGHLTLLERSGRDVLVPARVVQEIVAGPPQDPARLVLQAGWAEELPEESVREDLLEWGLGAGETAVLEAAMRRGGATALLDDDAARRCARAVGVPVLGTLGIVIRAAKQGLAPAAAPVVRDLIGAGLFIREDVVAAVLQRSLGERWPPA